MIRLCHDSYAAIGPGGRIDLPPRQFSIAELLARRPGVVRTRDEILDALGDHGDIADRTIDSHICHLRKRLRRIGPDPIRCRHGFGYFWERES